AAGAADVARRHERRAREKHTAPDQVGERILEDGRVEANAIAPEPLLDAGVPRKALLGLERWIRKAGEEQIVERRRAEPRAGAAVDPRARLLDQERERATLGHRAAEDVVVLDANAG